MSKALKPARRSATNPSARARAAKPRARTRASEAPPPDLDDEDDTTPPPVFTPAQLRARADGWSPERQVRFVEALAESGCVEEACRSVGLSKQSAYNLRMRVDAQGFRMAWEAAMELAIRRLSDECYARALHGEEVPHFYQGELIGTHRRYDNRLAMFLLRYRDPLRYAATLDKMVYTGHPEGAALAFAKARNRCAEEAWGVADQPAEPVDPAPWTSKPIAEAQAEELEERLVENIHLPVGGTWERRDRIGKLRVQRHAPRVAERERARRAKEAELFAGITAALEPIPRANRATQATGKPMPGGDMPSTSSTSEPDPPPRGGGDAQGEGPPSLRTQRFAAAAPRAAVDSMSKPPASPPQRVPCTEPALRRLD